MFDYDIDAFFTMPSIQYNMMQSKRDLSVSQY